MIQPKQSFIHESSGVDTEFQFTAKLENLGQIFHILRNQLYSDPILAIIREISCNGYDSHIAAKNKNPIKITFPNAMESFFKVRDYGTGLTEQEVQDIFCSYGESTKRNSKNAIGCLGIGAKSPFSYTDSFTVSSFKDGKLTIYNAYIDETNRGSMAIMATTETSEPNGIEVVVPVKSQDTYKFKEKAAKFFSFWKAAPEFDKDISD